MKKLTGKRLLPVSTSPVLAATCSKVVFVVYKNLSARCNFLGTPAGRSRCCPSRAFSICVVTTWLSPQTMTIQMTTLSVYILMWSMIIVHPQQGSVTCLFLDVASRNGVETRKHFRACATLNESLWRTIVVSEYSCPSATKTMLARTHEFPSVLSKEEPHPAGERRERQVPFLVVLFISFRSQSNQ